MEEEIIELYSSGLGCDTHVMGEGDRADDIMDTENCEKCRDVVFQVEDRVRDELGLPVIRRAKRRCSEFNVDFNSIAGVGSLLTLEWDWLTTSLKNQIMKHAKSRRSCGHKGKRKECEQCLLSQLQSQYQWEVDNNTKRRRIIQERIS